MHHSGFKAVAFITVDTRFNQKRSKLDFWVLQLGIRDELFVVISKDIRGTIEEDCKVNKKMVEKVKKFV